MHPLRGRAEQVIMNQARDRFVGVDVVDLTRARAERPRRSRRFLERVFSARERERIDAAREPQTEVWRMWAAKEAAYKVISKLGEAPPPFHHARFEVQNPPDEPVTRLAWEDVQISLGFRVEPAHLLAWAWIGPVTPLFVGHESVDSVRARREVTGDPEIWIPRQFSEEESDAIHGLESALVRLAAREDAAHLLGVREARLAIVCPPGHTGLRPPYLLDQGAARADADISLSHDGSRLAWAIRVTS